MRGDSFSYWTLWWAYQIKRGKSPANEWTCIKVNSGYNLIVTPGYQISRPSPSTRPALGSITWVRPVVNLASLFLFYNRPISDHLHPFTMLNNFFFLFDIQWSHVTPVGCIRSDLSGAADLQLAFYSFKSQTSIRGLAITLILQNIVKGAMKYVSLVEPQPRLPCE
jgi:hypothetical protein